MKKTLHTLTIITTLLGACAGDVESFSEKADGNEDIWLETAEAEAPKRTRKMESVMPHNWRILTADMMRASDDDTLEVIATPKPNEGCGAKKYVLEYADDAIGYDANEGVRYVQISIIEKSLKQNGPYEASCDAIKLEFNLKPVLRAARRTHRNAAVQNENDTVLRLKDANFDDAIYVTYR